MTDQLVLPDYDVPPLVPSPQLTNFSHIHINTPVLEESAKFFTEIIGMIETHREKDTIYLRAWGEWMHHSLVLKQADEPGVECMSFRVKSPEHVEDFAERLRAAGNDVLELPAGTEAGQGDAIRVSTPGGHELELFHAFDRIDPPANRSLLRNQPDPFPGQGIAARRFDHASVLDPSPATTRHWLEYLLGFHAVESSPLPDGDHVVNAMAVSSQSHDINFFKNMTGDSTPMLHHFAFRVDQVHDLFRASNLYKERGIAIESGPGQHGGSQGWFIYVREPGGNRVELHCGGFQMQEPVWDALLSGPDDVPNMLVWIGAPMTPEFLFSGTSSMPRQSSATAVA